MASISARSLGVAAPGRLPQEIQRITAQGGPLRQQKILTKIYAFAVLDAAQLPGVERPVQTAAQTHHGPNARKPLLRE